MIQISVENDSFTNSYIYIYMNIYANKFICTKFTQRSCDYNFFSCFVFNKSSHTPSKEMKRNQERKKNNEQKRSPNIK